MKVFFLKTFNEYLNIVNKNYNNKKERQKILTKKKFKSNGQISNELTEKCSPITFIRYFSILVFLYRLFIYGSS